MRITDVLRHKGDDGRHHRPGRARSAACSTCSPSIGSVPLSSPRAPGAVDGIVSERDVVRGLQRGG